MSRVRLPLWSYFGSVVEEGKKVIWPNRDTVIRHTVMVIVSVALAMLIFSSIDFGLQKLVILVVNR